MLVGHARVSAQDHNPRLQLDALKAAGSDLPAAAPQSIALPTASNGAAAATFRQRRRALLAARRRRMPCPEKKAGHKARPVDQGG
jgi:hypothetical protein